MKVIIKVTPTTGDNSHVDFDAAYVDLTPELLTKAEDLIKLVNEHGLSEARKHENSVIAFDLAMLHDCEDIEPALEARYLEIQGKAEKAFEKGKPFFKLGDHFDFPEEREVDLGDYIVELVALDDMFYWHFMHRKYNEGWETRGFTKKEIDKLKAAVTA